MKTLIPLLSIFFPVLLAAAQDATSCKCAPADPVKEAFQQASTVFIGRVEEVGKSPFHPEMNEVRFALLNDYKHAGESAGRTRLVFTPLAEGTCGYKFVPGQEYLVYATGNPAFYKTSICSRTTFRETAHEEITKLMEIAPAEKNEEGK